MDSLSPFLQDSFIPYFMPVYPGAPQHSTGPRTEAGKAVSSQNALKHGLTAQTVLLPGEDEAAYRKMCEGLFDEFQPETTSERELVQFLCDTHWRLSRCSRLEVRALSSEYPDFKALDVISKHEVRLKKTYSTTLKEVHDKIASRLHSRAEAMGQAMVIRRADVLKSRPTDLNALGFVFTVKEVDQQINREDVLRRAVKVVSQQFAA
jgi:hypothetical protein